MAPAASPSPGRPAANRFAELGKKAAIGLLNEFDGFAQLRYVLGEIAQERGDWAGIPMPLTGERLVLEPTYPNAQALMDIGLAESREEVEEDQRYAGAKIRNRFWSWHKRSDVVIYELADGKIKWGIIPGTHHLGFDIQTLACSEAWGIEQEHAALNTLGTLLSHRQMKQYLLTGMFMEHSPRSRLTYMFRKLKPTVVLNCREDSGNKDGRIICALCMHPIGYYAGSWAGAMTPSDDIIAHLSLMRGDEAMLWRRANQHPSWRPEAGL